jgi:large subunit ribosomal protein L4
MADAQILGGAGGSSNKVKLDDAAFAVEFNGPLVHESVRAEQAARRQGTHATKTRGNVRGGGAKPWRQKGTGRARAGSSRSPIWTGGGTVFGPQPRHYTFKVNRKERRAALRSALSVHAERGTIAAIDPQPFVDQVSTKNAAKLLGDLLGKGPLLIILTDEHERAALSFRNLPRVSVLPVEAVGVVDVIGSANIVASQQAIEALTTRATKELRRGGAGDSDREAPGRKHAEVTA